MDNKKHIPIDSEITDKLLDVDLYIWYGSAAIPAYLEVHKKLRRMSAKRVKSPLINEKKK